MSEAKGKCPHGDRLAEALNKEPETVLALRIALALRPGEDVEAHSYHAEAVKLLEYANKRVITTIEDAKLATDDLSVIGKLEKAMISKRVEKLAPHEVQVKAIRDTYNYLMAPILDAKTVTKQKQTAFLIEQKLRQQEQEEINRKRIEAAEAEQRLMGELTESVNLVEVTKAPSRISTDFGATGLTDHWKFEVINFSLVPDDCKVIDSVMLNSIAKKHHDTKQIPGIKFYNEPYLTTRMR